MKKYILTSYFILALLILTGCSLPFLSGNEEEISNMLTKTYKVQGTVLDKTEKDIIIATSVLTGKVKSTENNNSNLKIGDTVRVLITPEEIISILNGEQQEKQAVVISEGFDYESLGYIGDKVTLDDSYYLQIAGNMVSGDVMVSNEVFNQTEVGQEVKIFANLDGIQGVAVVPSVEENQEDEDSQIIK